MVLSCLTFKIICDVCVALGGLGTFLTLIFLIYDSIRKSKNIDTVQKIQSLQLETLYEPDIRIASWRINKTGVMQNEIVLINHGQNIILTAIYEKTHSSVLNIEGMNNWFPFHFDKGCEIHIPMTNHFSRQKESFQIAIECLNRLGFKYEMIIENNNEKVVINRPSLL